MSEPSTGKFYITTAIDYVNARPHIGTAYEKIAADFIARSRRLMGLDTRFVMGNDEHSINVARSAKKAGLSPTVYCDQMEKEFREVWSLLNISFDDFIRTTEGRHRQAVQAIFSAIHKAGDIYKGTYEGYYCDSCEAFLQEKDLVEGLCPHHKKEPQWLKEDNYFFALSKFQDRLLALIRENPKFVQPEIRRNEVLKVIEGGLLDISVSRSTAEWGIPLPINESHVVYVWFDALINYVSALGFPTDDEGLMQRYWPCDLHVIGKDITRFHCIIWPAMLMSAGVPLPESVWAHGFVSLKGERLSKSTGNVIAPREVTERFGVDGFRYLFLREVPFNRDGDFSWEVYTDRYNSELANDLGNLLSRTLAMVKRYCDASVPVLNLQDAEDQPFLTVIKEATEAYQRHLQEFAIHSALDAAASLVQAANRYIEENKPWALAKNRDENGARLETVLRNLLESLRIVSIMVFPAMPTKAREMRQQLGLADDFAALRYESELCIQERDWQCVTPAGALFPRLDPVE